MRTSIYSLMQKVKEFENGDFTVRSHLRGKDEIGELGQSFNSKIGRAHV